MCLYLTTLLFVWCSLFSSIEVWATDTIEAVTPQTPYGVMEFDRVAVVYSGWEKLRYELSYTGGIKLGELSLELRPVPGLADHYEIYMLATTEGSIFNIIYPVHDVHITRVRGKERLPYFYEVWQQEGYSYEAHKITEYDQASGTVTYIKNEHEPQLYNVEPPVHNEFSSFIASRLMSFEVGKSFLVPTFADKKRTDVEVNVMDKKHLKDSVLGPVDVFLIVPILKFKGLYDKRGETRIWYSDDECRVPVEISSELALGSVTAILLSYENPLCPLLDKGVLPAEP